MQVQIKTPLFLGNILVNFIINLSEEPLVL